MQAVLSNPSHPEYGNVTIPFPIPDEEYAHCIDLLATIEIGGVRVRDCLVEGLSEAPPILEKLVGTEVNVDELDFLARLRDSFWGDEEDKFQALGYKLGSATVEDFINLSFCCRQATVITDFSKLEEVGKDHYLTLHGGCAPADEVNRLDGERFAKELIASGKGTVTPYGVVFENNFRLEPVYTGQSFPPYLDRKYMLELEYEPSPAVPEESQAVTLFLPMPEKRLERMLERAEFRAADDMRLGTWQTEFPQAIDDCLDVPHEDLYELNKLCAETAAMNQKMLDKLAAVALIAKPEGAYQLRMLAKYLDQFEFVSGVTNSEEYGKYMIQESGRFDYDENLKEFYDYRSFGEQRIAWESGEFCEMGYVAYYGLADLKQLMMKKSAEQGQSGLEMGGM